MAGRQRLPALPAHPRSCEAGRALRRPLPDHRLRAVEHGELGDPRRSTCSPSTSRSRWPSTSSGPGAGAVGYDDFVTVVPAQMRMGETWYRGTADSVFQNLHLIEEYRADAVLVFGADHIYKMNIRQMIDFHFAEGGGGHHRLPAHQEVGGQPVRHRPDRQRGADDRVPGEARARTPSPSPATPSTAWARWATTCSRPGPLIEELRADAETRVAPRLRPQHPPRHGEDAGGSSPTTSASTGSAACPTRSRTPTGATSGRIDAYYEANMDLKNVVPSLNLYNWEWPIITRQLPRSARQAGVRRRHPARRGAAVDPVGRVHRRRRLRQGLGAGAQRVHRRGRARCEARSCSTTSTSDAARASSRAIIDKNVRVADGDHIGHDLARDALRHTVSEGGITVVPKGPRHAAHAVAKLLGAPIGRRNVSRSRSSSTATSISRRGRIPGPTRCRASRRPPRSTTGTPASTPSATAPTPSPASTTRTAASTSIVNNYDRLSFNFGPTLARWIGRHDPRSRRAPARRRRGPAPAARARRAPWRRPMPTPSFRCCHPADRAHADRCGGWRTFERRFGGTPRGCGCRRPAVSTGDAGDADRPRRDVHHPGARADRGRRARHPRRDGADWTRSTATASTRGAPTSGATATARAGASRLAYSTAPLSRAVAFGEAGRPRREFCRRGRGRRPSAPRSTGRAWCCARRTASSGATTRSSPI